VAGGAQGIGAAASNVGMSGSLNGSLQAGGSGNGSTGGSTGSGQSGSGQ
jgi:hypothetical protein